MNRQVAEWLKQSDYDMDTADFMAEGGRYFYAVFMCHLAVEKALKGLYQEHLGETPPKTHNRLYLLNRIGLRPDEDRGRVITRLNEPNIATWYHAASCRTNHRWISKSPTGREVSSSSATSEGPEMENPLLARTIANEQAMKTRIVEEQVAFDLRLDESEAATQHTEGRSASLLCIGSK